MINKIYYIVGSAGHTSIRVRAKELIEALPQLIKSGKVKDVENWGGHWGGVHISDTDSLAVRFYFNKDQLYDLIEKLHLKILRYDEQDNSFAYDHESNENSLMQQNGQIPPEQIIYI